MLKLIRYQTVLNHFSDQFNEGGNANRFVLRNDPYHLLKDSISAWTFNPSPSVSHFLSNSLRGLCSALFANRLVTSYMSTPVRQIPVNLGETSTLHVNKLKLRVHARFITQKPISLHLRPWKAAGMRYQCTTSHQLSQGGLSSS